jgi:hypothetical protein
MSNTTQYSIVRNGEVLGTKSKKASAITVAEGLYAEDPTQTVEVQTSNGSVVHSIEARTGKGARPWTRTEPVGDLELSVPAGYTVAYKRPRIGALVARANDRSGWLVITADGTFPADNTKDARLLTNDLAAAYKTARAEQLEADKAAKAEAKAKRDQERAEAKAQKEADKAAKREAKEKEAAEAEQPEVSEELATA